MATGSQEMLLTCLLSAWASLCSLCVEQVTRGRLPCSPCFYRTETTRARVLIMPTHINYLSAHVTSLVLLYALNKLLGGDYHVRLVLSALETTRARVLIMPTHLHYTPHIHNYDKGPHGPSQSYIHSNMYGGLKPPFFKHTSPT